ncbi:hypothetical protein K488DRAFT_91529 [Vararia minispora EC-137]|uniref:Uncharacterized protein n=1 Tax=Vararia minispora EC-137 TaxID=1314806 RepID=A0ACB8Q5U0_9AGAM|nr:hypothetical protein K488DRAFT_91529 [Vararia minispora EC-137]
MRRSRCCACFRRYGEAPWGAGEALSRNTAHLEAKEAGKGAVKVSNIQASKFTDAKLKKVLMLLEDMHDIAGTEWLLLVGRGVAKHTYPPSAHCTPNAKTWMQSALLQRLAPIKAAELLDSFVTVGHIKTMCNNDEPRAEVDAKQSLKHPHTSLRMNYPNYNKVFVYNLGIELKGWPLPGPIRNPGLLGVAHCSVLLTALQKKRCYWAKLSKDEWEQSVTDLDRREANGEQVYKPRKPRASKRRHLEENSNDDADDENEDIGNRDRQGSLSPFGIGLGSVANVSANANAAMHGNSGMQLHGSETYDTSYGTDHIDYSMDGVGYDMDSSHWGAGFSTSMASSARVLDNDELAFNCYNY